MTCSLEFTGRVQLEKDACCRFAGSQIEANRLARLPDCYKIKLRSSGCRLAVNQNVVVSVVAVDKRVSGAQNRKAADCLSG